MTTQVLIPSLALDESVIRYYKRELPKFGEVLVAVGDTVRPDTIVAKTTLPGALFIVRVAHDLGVEPHEVGSLLKVNIGDIVTNGQEIATLRGLFGFFSSHCISRFDGTVEFVSAQTGNIGIRAPQVAVELRAHVSGTVVEVIKDRGVVLKAHGAFMQGVFGVGGERTGRLKMVPVAPSETIRRSKIPDNIEGCILFGGSSITVDALSAAAERGAVGVITGSIDDETLTTYVGQQIGVAVTGDEKVPLTLIITEGFGTLPINVRVLDLLKKFEGTETSINGATQVRAGAVRPEALIFHGLDMQDSSQRTTYLAVGAKVRLIRHPYFGEIGTIAELPMKPQLLETGAHARVLQVRLSTGENVTVPRANAELVG